MNQHILDAQEQYGQQTQIYNFDEEAHINVERTRKKHTYINRRSQQKHNSRVNKQTETHKPNKPPKTTVE